MRQALVWLLVGAFIVQALAWGRHMQSPHPENCLPVDTTLVQQFNPGD